MAWWVALGACVVLADHDMVGWVAFREFLMLADHGMVGSLVACVVLVGHDMVGGLRGVLCLLTMTFRAIFRVCTVGIVYGLMGGFLDMHSPCTMTW